MKKDAKQTQKEYNTKDLNQPGSKRVVFHGIKIGLLKKSGYLG
jgi:hypothetical protein